MPCLHRSGSEHCDGDEEHVGLGCRLKYYENNASFFREENGEHCEYYIFTRHSRHSSFWSAVWSLWYTVSLHFDQTGSGWQWSFVQGRGRRNLQLIVVIAPRFSAKKWVEKSPATSAKTVCLLFSVVSISTWSLSSFRSILMRSGLCLAACQNRKWHKHIIQTVGGCLRWLWETTHKVSF